MTTEMIEQVFDISGMACLQVQNISGSVIVQPGEAGVIRVSAAKHTHTGDSKRTWVEVSQAADGSVSAITRFDRDGMLGWLFGANPCDVDYVVKVPSDCNVKINGVSSGAMISDLNGSCDVHTVSGEITLIGLNGPIGLDTVSGPVAGQQLAGILKVKSVSGDVCLRDSELSQVEINTVSGEILLETPLGDGPYQLHSVSGNARLIVPVGTGCIVDLHSFSGEFGSDLPINTVERRLGNCHAQIQGGGPQIHMNSVSGCLWLETSNKANLSVDSASATIASSHCELLDRVEKGELTVDDALSALREG